MRRFLSSASVPQSTDLLAQYRALVASGKIEYDEDQVRVVIELRKLHKRLRDYAPSQACPQYFQPSATPSASADGKDAAHAGQDNDDRLPWYVARRADSGRISGPEYALVRAKSLAEDLATLDTPKGLLLIGPPGTGKSMLADLFFANVPTPHKARQHYAAFVLELYRGVWEETQARMVVPSASGVADLGNGQRRTQRPAWTRALREHWRALVENGDLPKSWAVSAISTANTGNHPPIAFVLAHRLVLRSWLLIFDEVQLLDVSSAGLLADVLGWYWRMGGVVVGTSNALPEDLYRQGTQRERLAPFLDALKARCPVVETRSGKDWRVKRAEKSIKGTWFTTDELDQYEAAITAASGGVAKDARPATISVFGRRVEVPWSAQGVCKYSFGQLCNESLGAADYLSLTAAYHTIAITNIPILTFTTKNQARRFITLIDALYESRCRLICLAAVRPEDLFFPEAKLDVSAGPSHLELDSLMAEAISETREVYRPNVSSYNAPSMAEERSAPRVPLALENLSIFSGHDEQFAYKRALSRLLEMTSEDYGRDATWTPLPPSSRKWEAITSSTATAPGTASPERTRTRHSENDDFADEAAYAGPIPRDERPAAPRLREHHVWGVREDWGERAGEWGRGSRARQRDSAKDE